MTSLNLKNNVICILGPTGSGKTQIALELAECLPIDIISVDSAMIYRYMNIGTAKPSLEILAKYPHKLIDVKDPKESYSVGHFFLDVNYEIQQSLKKKRIPLLVGGTMMYFNTLMFGLSQLPQANYEIRNKILEEAQKEGWYKLHKRLQLIDPVSFLKIQPTDPQRIQRALEVFYLTGKTITELQQQSDKLPYTFTYFGIKEDKSVLHEIIKLRLEQMLRIGFIDEVKYLFDGGDLNANMSSMRSVGYKEIWEYLAGKITYNEMKYNIICSTNNLAKRQLTWMKKWNNINYLSRDHMFDQIIKKFHEWGYYATSSSSLDAY